jgi:hypothetical protein
MGNMHERPVKRTSVVFSRRIAYGQLRGLQSTGEAQYLRRTEAETRVVMKPVVQLERTGCGIASVAALAGVRYREMQRVADRLGIVADDARLWSETSYARRLLKEFGIRPASTAVPFSSWEDLPNLALLAAKWHKERDRVFWHWVVYWVVFWRGPHGPVVFDSQRTLRNHKRTDFGRMKPKWFIPVRPT